jgi:hypothetical protein
MTLPNILRVDAHLHRLLPADTELCDAIAVLARAHQDAIWARTKAIQHLRAVLREFYPTFLAVFASRFPLGIASPEARAVLAIAPAPATAATLSVTRIAATLRRAGRSRGIDETAAEIKVGLRKTQLRQSVLVENAMGKHALALLAALDTACVNVDELGQASAELFRTHPEYEVITSFPGLADSTGARVLAEIGDDRTRFADARALKAYAGSAPVTRASGRSSSITHRHIKNNRLANVGWMWAFRQPPPTSPPGSTTGAAQTRTRRPPRRRQPAPLQQTPRPALPVPSTRQAFDAAKAFPRAIRRRGLISICATS